MLICVCMYRYVMYIMFGTCFMHQQNTGNTVRYDVLHLMLINAGFRPWGCHMKLIKQTEGAYGNFKLAESSYYMYIAIMCQRDRLHHYIICMQLTLTTPTIKGLISDKTSPVNVPWSYRIWIEINHHDDSPSQTFSNISSHKSNFVKRTKLRRLQLLRPLNIEYL